MLITRTPLRISLGGGGTDLESYYRRFGGYVVAGAISKYVYIGVNETFTDDYLLKYAQMERVADPCGIQHPILREALLLHGMGPGLEIVSLADVPAGTGLGSSGTFTVGLLRALHAVKREHCAAQDLAEEACHIEIERLRRSGGKQDQYIAAFGGLQILEFDRSGRVEVSPLRIRTDDLHTLDERLLLFFTGYSRDADSLLSDQRLRTDAGEPALLDNMREIERIGRETRSALESGELRRFGELMHEHWLVKRGRSAGMTSTLIDRWYEHGRAHGALGGKLVGAGGGGFLLFYTEDADSLRAAMAEHGLRELRFSFEHEGSSLVVRG